MRRITAVFAFCFVLVLSLPAFAQSPLIGVGESEELGLHLVGPDGYTLYQFSRDGIDTSACVDQCAVNWPPLVVESAADVSAAEGISGTLGIFEREDGTLQVTYNGSPLYYWANDAAVGDTTGHRVGNVWWIVPPATVSVQKAPELGSILVGPDGYTLYLFDNDTRGESSACTGGCAAAWPPLVVESADDIVAGVNLPGELATIEREDGILQVTYNGWPLYYFQSDAAIGDATGEGSGGVWHTLVPETLAVVTNETLGDILVSTTGRTVYRFTQDADGTSACNGDCATSWPPYTIAEGERLFIRPNVEGEVGTITRDDGALQVTYNGSPLYFWQGDAAPGDANGHEMGGVWFVVTP